MTAPFARLGAAMAAFLVALAIGIAGPASASEDEAFQPQQSGTFDETQTQAIERIVRSYILENPDIIREAIQALRAREQQAAEERRQQALAAHKQSLKESDVAPVLGNPDGDVTIVEFFDYRCPYCRSVADMVRETVEADGNVRLVMKEFPILGSESLYAARAALAAARQDGYEDFHFALMSAPDKVDSKAVLAIAAEQGLDIEQLQSDMEDEAIATELRRNYRLAQALEINGTPAFVVGDAVVPGALDRNRLESLIADARRGEG